MVLSKCAICRSKKSRFIRNQEAKGLLSNLGLRIYDRKSNQEKWSQNICQMKRLRRRIL